MSATKKQQMEALVGSFDNTDPFNKSCEKYRRKIIERGARALKDGEFEAFASGTIVAAVQVLALARDITTANIGDTANEKDLRGMIEFAIVQAFDGRVVSDDAILFAMNYSPSPLPQGRKG